MSGPEVEYEGLFGTWLSSCSGPLYPQRDLETDNAICRPFLNVVGVSRVSRLNKEQMEKICEALEKISSSWIKDARIPIREIQRLIRNSQKNMKDLTSDQCAAFVHELEKFPMDARKWITNANTENDLVFRTESCLLQILKTYEHLRERFSWIHGDLRLDNILVKDSNYERLEYPGENKTHILESKSQDDGVPKKLQICAMADLGFSASDSREVMNSMGVKSFTEWNDFTHEIGYDTDLHLLGLTIGTAVAGTYRIINEKDPEGKVLALLKFCAEMLLPVKFMFQDGKIGTGNINFAKLIGIMKSEVDAAQTAEMACEAFLKKWKCGICMWYDILYIQREAMIKDMKSTNRKFSEHIFFEEYEKKKKRKRKRNF